MTRKNTFTLLQTDDRRKERHRRTGTHILNTFIEKQTYHTREKDTESSTHSHSQSRNK